MERYEIMLIISPELEKEEHEEILGGLTSEIEKGSGSVNIILDWRRRRLAYEINKLHDGHYYLVYFTAQGSIIPEIEHYFKVTDSVMRYMIVRATEQEFAAAIEKAEREAAKAKEESEKKAAEEMTEAETAEEMTEAETAEEMTEAETAEDDASETKEEDNAEISAEEKPDAENVQADAVVEDPEVEEVEEGAAIVEPENEEK